MSSQNISFKDTGFFSELICGYLEQKKELSSFYHRFPVIENFKAQILEKQASITNEQRKVLADSLQKQYQSLANVSEVSSDNISALALPETFTITTGHQLNLFTGPLYFLYKIISTINLTEELKNTYSEYNFVPVYWMATEDHDFLEVNYFSFKGKKIAWNKTEGLENKNGAVGEYDTDGLNEVFEVIEKTLGENINATYLKKLFENGYLKHDNLTDATRYIVNELFGSYGLVIVDGNDKNLKSLFVPVMKQELNEQVAFNEVKETSDKLEKLGYNPQVTPREINLFYLIKGIRERIVIDDEGKYAVLNTNIKWDSYKFIEQELENYPERFSPNVILRPVFQEVILPNLCYIGGGGELAYWFQLKSNFEALNIPFPILLLRNSALLISVKQQHKLQALSVNSQELFMKQFELINYKVRQISDITIDFSAQKIALKKQFEDLKELAKQTDKTFINAVNAQETKQLKGLDVLEKRLLKAQRIKLSDQVSRLTDIHRELFPQNSLQERKANFSEFYLEYGDTLIHSLKKQLKPLSGLFNLVIIK